MDIRSQNAPFSLTRIAPVSAFKKYNKLNPGEIGGLYVVRLIDEHKLEKGKHCNHSRKVEADDFRINAADFRGEQTNWEQLGTTCCN